MVAWDWLKDEEDTYVTENLMTTKEMWENDDTQPAFDDENKDHMRIQDVVNACKASFPQGLVCG